MKIRPNEVMIVNNRLTQIGLSFRGPKTKVARSRPRIAVFSCECGGKKITQTCAVKNGSTKSCGCMKSESYAFESVKRTKHNGKVKFKREYSSWKSMRARCSNKKLKSYADYGARGIRVCDRWNDFTLFLADMGPRPEGTSIERLENNGMYDPSNCKWGTQEEQKNNKRTNRIIEIDGVQRTLAQWSRISGISHTTILCRLSRSHIWTAKDAVFSPVDEARSRRIKKHV